MALQKLTEHIVYLPTQPERERPLLAYVYGSRLSLAIDAGYSQKHISLFYSELKSSGFQPPDFTVLTHWHCDHSFALHAASGLSIAYRLTNERLKKSVRDSQEPGYREYMMTDPFFGIEYSPADPILVAPADIEFTDELTLDLGGVTARMFHTVSPHTLDSVCVHVPEERALFLGDAIYGNYAEHWRIDPDKLRSLISVIESIDCDWCLPSHAKPHTKESMLRYLQRKL